MDIIEAQRVGAANPPTTPSTASSRVCIDSASWPSLAGSDSSSSSSSSSRHHHHSAVLLPVDTEGGANYPLHRTHVYLGAYELALLDCQCGTPQQRAIAAGRSVCEQEEPYVRKPWAVDIARGWTIDDAIAACNTDLLADPTLVGTHCRNCGHPLLDTAATFTAEARFGRGMCLVRFAQEEGATTTTAAAAAATVPPQQRQQQPEAHRPLRIVRSP